MVDSSDITAQSEYKRILGAHLAPVMKTAGYKRTRNTWQRATEHARLIVNVQASQWSHRTRVSFTGNICVVSLAVHRLLQLDLHEPHEFQIRESPPRFWHFESRIGALLPQGRETWWNLDLSSSGPSEPEAGTIRGSPDELGADFASAIERFGLPFLNAVDTPAGLLAAIDGLPHSTPMGGVRDALILIVHGPEVFRRHWMDVRGGYENSEFARWRRAGKRLLDACSQMES